MSASGGNRRISECMSSGTPTFQYIYPASAGFLLQGGFEFILSKQPRFFAVLFIPL